MIDRGLLATMALIAVVVAGLDRALRRRSTHAEPIMSLASTPMLVGLAVGRLAAVFQDDPGTLRRPFDLLLIRGGMEFWPGAAAALAAAWVTSRRGPSRPAERLIELAPFALWAYAVYEAACVLRDGCFGPFAAVGLRPGGSGERQLPVGILVGLVAAALGAAVWRWSGRLGWSGVMVLSVGGLAAIRIAAGFLLPKVTAGLTRPHVESIAVLVITLVGSVVLRARAVPERRRRVAGEARASLVAREPHARPGAPPSGHTAE